MDTDVFFVRLRPLVETGTRELADTVYLLVNATTAAASEMRTSAVDIEAHDDAGIRRGLLDPRLFAAFTSGQSDRIPAVLKSIAAKPAPAAPLDDAGFASIVTGRIDPLVHAVLHSGDGSDIGHAPRARLETARDDLSRAWSLLASLQPGLHALLADTLREVLLFGASEQNSFASLSVHGLAGINVARDTGLTWALDDLAHQGGHVIFNAATSETRRFLRVDGRSTLDALDLIDGDPRELYGAFHGLFTYTCILATLDAALLEDMLAPLDRVLAFGRIAFYLRKFRIDRDALDRRSLYTDAGLALYDTFAGACDHYLRRYADRSRCVVLSDQPYQFCSRRFLAQNDPCSMLESVSALCRDRVLGTERRPGSTLSMVPFVRKTGT